MCKQSKPRSLQKLHGLLHEQNENSPSQQCDDDNYHEASNQRQPGPPLQLTQSVYPLILGRNECGPITVHDVSSSKSISFVRYMLDIGEGPGAMTPFTAVEGSQGLASYTVAGDTRGLIHPAELETQPASSNAHTAPMQANVNLMP